MNSNPYPLTMANETPCSFHESLPPLPLEHSNNSYPLSPIIPTPLPTSPIPHENNHQPIHIPPLATLSKVVTQKQTFNFSSTPLPPQMNPTPIDPYPPFYDDYDSISSYKNHPYETRQSESPPNDSTSQENTPGYSQDEEDSFTHSFDDEKSSPIAIKQQKEEEKAFPTSSHDDDEKHSPTPTIFLPPKGHPYYGHFRDGDDVGRVEQMLSRNEMMERNERFPPWSPAGVVCFCAKTFLLFDLHRTRNIGASQLDLSPQKLHNIVVGHYARKSASEGTQNSFFD